MVVFSMIFRHQIKFTTSYNTKQLRCLLVYSTLPVDQFRIDRLFRIRLLLHTYLNEQRILLCKHLMMLKRCLGLLQESLIFIYDTHTCLMVLPFREFYSRYYCFSSVCRLINPLRTNLPHLILACLCLLTHVLYQ